MNHTECNNPARCNCSCEACEVAWYTAGCPSPFEGRADHDLAEREGGSELERLRARVAVLEKAMTQVATVLVQRADAQGYCHEPGTDISALRAMVQR